MDDGIKDEDRLTQIRMVRLQEMESRISELEAELAESRKKASHLGAQIIGDWHEREHDLRASNTRLRAALRNALDFINDWKTENRPDEDFEKWFGNLARELEGE